MSMTDKKHKIKDLATLFNRNRDTILLWIHQESFPNAKLNTDGVSPFWEIPEQDVSEFTPPRRGKRKKINEVLSK
jgi:hypothetical protein